MEKPDITPGKALYNNVRGAFVAHGTSLSAWCAANEVTRQWAEQCLTGKAKGDASDALLRRLVDAARDIHDADAA